MISLIDVGNTTARFIFRSIVRDDATGVYRHMESLSSLPESAFRERCRAALEGDVPERERRGKPWAQRLRGVVAAPLGRRDNDSLTLAHVALGVEAFARVPADLPPGSMLFPEQVRAAVALTQRSLIQMSTGEGKTYAILPAAFALACRHHRVFIVCANDYLAWRDATRTRRYWEFLGLTPGLCLHSGAEDQEWKARVVYTTLSALIFKTLDGEIDGHRPVVQTTSAAVLLDEADAILLDQAQGGFTVSRRVESGAFDWTFALETARELEVGIDVETDEADLSAALTLEGEKKLKARLGSAGSDATYFLARFSVESSYVALRMAREGTDFVVEEERVFPIDRITGKVERGKSAHWLVPLEFMRSYSPRPRTITLHETSPRLFFERFPHLSGLSGTVEDDSAEYFFTYGLPTIVIEPRRPRRGKIGSDCILQTRALAIRTLVGEVGKAVEAGRPVLVGTLTITDAQEAFEALGAALPPGCSLHCLTGKDDSRAAEVFSAAGNVGSVLVTTQLGGRGVTSG